jgi:isopentenyl-diphosphate delta-isomerase
MGIAADLHHVGTFHYNAHFSNGLSENELDHVLVGTVPAETVIHPNPEEAHAYRWVTLAQLQQELTNNPAAFTAWFTEALALALQDKK